MITTYASVNPPYNKAFSPEETELQSLGAEYGLLWALTGNGKLPARCNTVEHEFPQPVLRSRSWFAKAFVAAWKNFYT